MNQNGNKAVRWVTSLLCIVFFCLPLFVFGGAFLNYWWLSIHGNSYYFKFPYLQIALIYFVAGLAATGASLYGGICRSFYGLLLLPPVALCLVGAVEFPNILPIVGLINDSDYIDAVASGCGEWAANHNQYPANDLEIQETLKSMTRESGKVPSHGLRSPLESQYSQRGEKVLYQIVVENNASGPHVTHVTQRPGVVYYSVTPDLREYWLTMTVLPSRSPGFASLLKRQGNLYVVHGNRHEGESASQE